MNKTLKTILLSGLGLFVLIGGASLISSAVSNNDDNGLVEIHPDFKRGGLTEQGKYVETNETLYTPNAFECLGLEIDLEFERNIKFEVFYYDEYGSYLSSSDVQTENYVAVLPSNATHARIEITPDWSLIELEEDEEEVIKWYQVNDYANQLTIKVREFQFSDCEDVTVALPEIRTDTITFNGAMTWNEIIKTDEFKEADALSEYGINGGYFTKQGCVMTCDGKAVKGTDRIVEGVYEDSGISYEEWK